MHSALSWRNCDLCPRRSAQLRHLIVTFIGIEHHRFPTYYNSATRTGQLCPAYCFIRSNPSGMIRVEIGCPKFAMAFTLAFVHTSHVLIPMFAQLAKEHLGGIAVFHMADESLIKNTIAAGGLTKSTIRR